MKKISRKNFVFTFVLLSLGISFSTSGVNKEKKAGNSKQEILIYDPKIGPVYDDVYNEDKIKRHWPGGLHGFYMTNLEKATADISKQMSHFIPFISYCKRFPNNLEDAYKPIENAPKDCRPLKAWDFGIVTPWLDPWGRPYQIRYNKDRMELHMRSQGRRLDDPSDDIVRETLLSIHKDVYYAELEKCKKLSSEDRNCAFNRGWH